MGYFRYNPVLVQISLGRQISKGSPSWKQLSFVIIKILCFTRVCAGSNFIHDLYHPLGGICRRHGVQYHLYADDNQLYVSFKVGDAVDLLEAQRRIEMCIAEIKAWMVMFMLKLNDDKT